MWIFILHTYIHLAITYNVVHSTYILTFMYHTPLLLTHSGVFWKRNLHSCSDLWSTHLCVVIGKTRRRDTTLGQVLRLVIARVITRMPMRVSQPRLCLTIAGGGAGYGLEILPWSNILESSGCAGDRSEIARMESAVGRGGASYHRT